jgi:hypothetical protein
VDDRDLVTGEEEVVLAVAMAAWWRAARWRLRSISLGPRWRGWRRGVVAGWEGGREWGAPGRPSVQLKSTVAWPSLVVRVREAVPPFAIDVGFGANEYPPGPRLEGTHSLKQ